MWGTGGRQWVQHLRNRAAVLERVISGNSFADFSLTGWRVRWSSAITERLAPSIAPQSSPQIVRFSISLHRPNSVSRLTSTTSVLPTAASRQPRGMSGNGGKKA
jgi:hypothetical protein